MERIIQAKVLMIEKPQGKTPEEHGETITRYRSKSMFEKSHAGVIRSATNVHAASVKSVPYILFVIHNHPPGGARINPIPAQAPFCALQPGPTGNQRFQLRFP
jgi:hypothetical protein